MESEKIARAYFDVRLESDEAGRRVAEGQEGNGLVAFMAPDWCLPCRALAPSFGDKSLREAAKRKGVRFFYADTDELGRFAAEERISAIPTVVLYKDGEEVQRAVGMRSIGDYIRYIQESF